MMPIVILHGWNSQLSRWQAVVKQLEKLKIKVYLPALPGFNHQLLTKPYNTCDYVVWVKQYLEKKSIKRCILIGHSLGGQIACQLAAVNPQLVAKLILINSAGIRPGITLKRLIFIPIAKIGKWFFSLKPIRPLQQPFRQLLYLAARESDYLKSSPLMRQTLIQVINEDQQSSFTQISCPALLIWGGQDRMTPLKYGRKIHSLISGSKLIIFPSASHGLPFTHSEALVKEIIRFINL
ncbi:MAG: alpha/beta hydrolase [Candidatus Beckwithbacteria bacterium]